MSAKLAGIIRRSDLEREAVETYAATGRTPRQFATQLAASEKQREELVEALRGAHVAMSLASALPGVQEEYDFGPALKQSSSALRNATKAKE